MTRKETNLGVEEVSVTPEQGEARQGKVDREGGRATRRAGNTHNNDMIVVVCMILKMTCVQILFRTWVLLHNILKPKWLWEAQSGN